MGATMSFWEWLTVMGGTASIIGLFTYFAARNNGRTTRELIAESDKGNKILLKNSNKMLEKHSAILEKHREALEELLRRTPVRTLHINRRIK